MTRKHFLRKTKIDKTNVAFFIDHEVLRLQIPVTIIPRVHVLEGVDNTSSVESGDGVFEGTLVAKCSPEIAAEVSVGQNVDEFFI